MPYPNSRSREPGPAPRDRSHPWQPHSLAPGEHSRHVPPVVSCVLCSVRCQARTNSTGGPALSWPCRWLRTAGAAGRCEGCHCHLRGLGELRGVDFRGSTPLFRVEHPACKLHRSPPGAATGHAGDQPGCMGLVLGHLLSLLLTTGCGSKPPSPPEDPLAPPAPTWMMEQAACLGGVCHLLTFLGITLQPLIPCQGCIVIRRPLSGVAPQLCSLPPLCPVTAAWSLS